MNDKSNISPNLTPEPASAHELNKANAERLTQILTAAGFRGIE